LVAGWVSAIWMTTHMLGDTRWVKETLAGNASVLQKAEQRAEVTQEPSRVAFLDQVDTFIDTQHPWDEHDQVSGAHICAKGF